jgi:mannitol/fructose-specific phosphotransferase system IIA component (Ntr-type)
VSERGLNLEQLTSSSYVRIGLEAADKETAILQLLDVLLHEGAVPSEGREELLESVLRRERRLSTGLEAGVAIPHGTTALVTEEVAAVGIYPAGVSFDAVDGSLTKIVILLITPFDLRHRHVNNLAAIARQLLRPEVRLALLEAKTPEEVLATLRGA